MKDIKYIIVDDESIAHDIIKKYCSMLPNMHLKQNCYDAIEALQFLNGNSVDLIFLDLNMPKLKGFDFLKTLPYSPKIIVTTAYSEFALEGYELNIVDYLLKPFSFERFLKAINKAFIDTEIPKSINNQSKETVTENRIFLHINNKHIQIAIDEILYIEAAGNYTKIVLKSEEIHIRGTLSSIMELIPNDGFTQVHRSFFINRAHIKSIEGHQIFIANYVIPIGKYYKAEVDRFLNK